MLRKHQLKLSTTRVARGLLACCVAAASTGFAPVRTSGVETRADGCVSVSQPHPLVLVSVDGFRPDYIGRKLNPTLVAMANTGMSATLRPSFPTLTFPNHYTLVTGLTPDHHGIVNNTIRDAELGKFSPTDRDAVGDGRWWAQGTPLWEIASRRGMRSGTVFWPGSEASIHGVRPTYWLPYDVKMTAEARVDQALTWLALPTAQRPSFITVYLDDVDSAGHAYGPDSAQLDAALARVDQALGHLLMGLSARGVADDVNVVVVSDHGMAPAPLENTIFVDEILGADIAYFTALGIVAGFDPKAGHTTDEIINRLEHAGRRLQCWRREDVPPRFRYGANARVPEVVCLAPVGWRTSTRATEKRIEGKFDVGQHGYDNDLPEMRAILVARGPDIPRVRVGHVISNLDVFPMLVRLLGMPEQRSDGSRSLSTRLVGRAADGDPEGPASCGSKETR